MILPAATFKAETLKLDKNKPTVLVVSDSPGIHTGQAQVVRNIWKRIYATNKYNIVQLAWWHVDPVESVPWHILYTNRHPDGKMEMADKFGDLSLNNVVDQIKPNVCWCFSADTSVVTRAGILNVSQIRVGDAVLSVDPDTGVVTYKPVTAVWERTYTGDMVHIKARGTDLLVTADHQLLLRNKYNPKYEWTTADRVASHKTTTYKYFPEFTPIVGAVINEFNLYEYSQDLPNIGVQVSGFVSDIDMLRIVDMLKDRFNVSSAIHKTPNTMYIRLVGDKENILSAMQILRADYVVSICTTTAHHAITLQPAYYKMQDWLSLMGWYISEGGHERSDIRIYQSTKTLGPDNTQNVSTIHALLKRMGLHFTVVNKKNHMRVFVISSSAIASWFAHYCGATAYIKKIPQFAYTLDHTLLQNLYTTLMLGDGTCSRSTYNTTSKALAEDFLRLCVHMGKKPTITCESRNYGEPMWRIYTRRVYGDRSSFTFKDTAKIPVQNQKVFCCTVADNHTLLVGRNGKFQFTGQCMGDPWMLRGIISRRTKISGPIIAYIPADGGPLHAKPEYTPIAQYWAEVMETIDHVVPLVPSAGHMFKTIFPGAHVDSPIPCGVDQTVYKPIVDQEKYRNKTMLFKIKPADKLVMSVGRNQQRKHTVINIAAVHFLLTGHYSTCQACKRYTIWNRDFVTARDIGPASKCKWCGYEKLVPGTPRDNLYYYMHIPLDELSEDSYRITYLLRQFDLYTERNASEHILTNNTIKSTHGMSEATMACYYATADLLAMPSFGEGFGMPLIEAIACGTQAIVPNYSAPPDFVGEAGRLVDIGYQWCEPQTSYWRGMVDLDAWVEAMDISLYHAPISKDACVRVAQQYNWDKIVPQWIALLDKCVASGNSNMIWHQALSGV